MSYPPPRGDEANRFVVHGGHARHELPAFDDHLGDRGAGEPDMAGEMESVDFEVLDGFGLPGFALVFCFHNPTAFWYWLKNLMLPMPCPADAPGSVMALMPYDVLVFDECRVAQYARQGTL
jgi:hypothetical protein